ncbi:unnamed protein product [marine sediment metagenome]|uniref:Uncharacterized protein n=1 Tax=marine sediment metagenome TaxID=412755 RepID=X1RUT1_9ZZZZ
MIIVRIFKNNAEKFANLISAVSFESCRRRLRLYFSNLNEIKEKIIAGEIIDLPYVTFQKDRRINKKKVRNERRKIYN